MTNMIFGFWCTNSRHRQDRVQEKKCCFCGADDEDWRHILTCNGTGSIIYSTGSWTELRSDLVKWPIHQDIRFAIKYGLQHFDRHPDKDNNPTPLPPFWIVPSREPHPSRQRYGITIEYWLAQSHEGQDIERMVQAIVQGNGISVS
jgi:hypothetical protein